MNRKTDLIVIGGGVAGLAATRELCAAGLNVVLLEARERLGGRILTRQTKDYPVELGAEFVHGRPPEILELAAEAGLPLTELQWNILRRKAGQWLDGDKTMEGVDNVFAKMSADGPDRSFQQFIEHVHAPEDVKEQAVRFVEGFHAADPRQVSVHSLVKSNAADEQVDGDRQFRLERGYHTLVEHLASRIDQQHCELELNTEVTAIRWASGEVTVAAREGAIFSATRALVTLPLGVLKAGAVRFDPEIREKQKALQGLEMGPVMRVSLCFRDKFWESDRRFRDVSFLFTDDPHFPTWWTSNPLPYPILTGWAAGHHAKALSQLNLKRVIDCAVESLAGILEIHTERLRRHLDVGFVHDWQADPFSCGAYSYGLVGGSEAPRELAAPVAGTLFFAGEATNNEGHNGTVHGAIATGKRAAKEILAPDAHR